MTSFNRAVNYIIVKIQSQCIYNLIIICIVQIVPIYNWSTNIASMFVKLNYYYIYFNDFYFYFFYNFLVITYFEITQTLDRFNSRNIISQKKIFLCNLEF